MIMNITKEQCRAARAILNINQSELAKATGIGRLTIVRYESDDDESSPNLSTLNKIENYFKNRGIEFIDGGVRKIGHSITTLEGKEGFAIFRKDVLEAVKNSNADVCISNLDERDFDKWGEGEVNNSYRDKMAKIRKNNPKLKFRSLIKEGDFHLSATRHSQYKWIDRNKFHDVPFYVYGEKTAIILFEDNNVTIFIINHPKLTKFYRGQFNIMWEKATDFNER